MKRNLKKGIWYASSPGKTVLEKFQAAKAAGFDGIEPHSHLDQDEVLRARDATGLAIASVSNGQSSWRGLSDPDAAKRAEAVESLKQALRDAKRYGASSVLVVPGSVSDEIPYAAAYPRVQGALRQAVPLAEELGVKLACENVWNHFLLSPLEGDNDWPAVMKALDEIGYQGWATAEPAWTPKGVDPAERLSQISGKLDQILAL